MKKLAIVEFLLLLISTIMICKSHNYIVNIVGIILLSMFTIWFMGKVTIRKKKCGKYSLTMLLVEYILLFINLNVFTRVSFSIGKWIIKAKGMLMAGVYLFALSIVLILWIIATLIWVFRIPKEYGILKSSMIIFGVILVVMFTSTIYYANIFEDYNKYYSTIEINDERGLFNANEERVTETIDYLYFSSAILFTIGYDDLIVRGYDLKIMLASEMFMSYLLMCIFVPSIFTLISDRK